MLVRIFESNDAILTAMVKGVLEDSGIPFEIDDSNDLAARLVTIPVMFAATRFLVPRECEAEARELLHQFALPAED